MSNIDNRDEQITDALTANEDPSLLFTIQSKLIDGI